MPNHDHPHHDHPHHDHPHHEHRPDCQSLIAQFSVYLDGEAPADLCAAIEAQCAACEECRALLTTLEATRRLTRALPAPTLPDDAAARLAACLGLT
jgi:anti-sigma factor RsiW